MVSEGGLHNKMMKMNTTLMAPLLLLITLMTGCQCVQWSAGPEDGATVYACEGQDLSLPWKITPDSGETFFDISWFFIGQTEQLIAVYSHHMSPSFSPSRVQHLSSGGIRIRHVTHGDAGRYRVKVTVHETGCTVVIHNRTAVLHVASESTARSDAITVVDEQPVAVYNEKTGQYHIQLTCKTRGYQPSSVVWETPSQTEILSSEKDGDSFRLLLTNPVVGGNYSCRIPPASPAARCLPRDDPAFRRSTVTVQEINARLTVLEAAQNGQRRNTNDSATDIPDWRDEVTRLTLDNAELRREVEMLKDMHSKRVIFYARLGTHSTIAMGQRIKPNVVSTNLGNAYSSSTGEFTVPFDGYYFITATSGGLINKYADMYVLLDGKNVGETMSQSVGYWKQGMCSYADHLTRGRRLWLQAQRNGTFGASWTTFSGFLVYPE